MITHPAGIAAGPPPPSAPAAHPWAAAAQDWAAEVNDLQLLNPVPVFATVDPVGVHLAYWAAVRCPSCGGSTPASHPWTVPPPEIGGVTWRWKHSCGQRWIPQIHVLRWLILEIQVPVGAAPAASHRNVKSTPTGWLLSERDLLTAIHDDREDQR